MPTHNQFEGASAKAIIKLTHKCPQRLKMPKNFDIVINIIDEEMLIRTIPTNLLQIFG